MFLLFPFSKISYLAFIVSMTAVTFQEVRKGRQTKGMITEPSNPTAKRCQTRRVDPQTVGKIEIFFWVFID